MNAALTKIANQIRVYEERFSTLGKPQSIDDDSIVDFSQGTSQRLKRRRLVLTAHGCKVATCTMCPLPHEAVAPSTIVPDETLLRQIDQACQNAQDVDVLTVYHNGNFFNSQEISNQVRHYLYAQVKNSGIKTLVVESLPHFITKAQLTLAKMQLGTAQLQVAIGLQSWNQFTREECINSPVKMKPFLDAIQLLKQFNFRAQVFVLFMPPFLNVGEAIKDLTESVTALHHVGIIDPIISPMRVTNHTVVQLMADRNLYYTPTVWQLFEALALIHKQVPGTKCRVAISTLIGTDGILAKRTATCPKCQKEVINQIRAYNQDHDLNRLTNLTCECRTTAYPLIWKSDLRTRINETLKALQ